MKKSIFNYFSLRTLLIIGIGLILLLVENISRHVIAFLLIGLGVAEILVGFLISKKR